MPIKIKQEGSETEIEVYTAEELESQRQEAAVAAAKEAAERTKAEIAADPNSAFAIARRDAEKKAKDSDKEVKRLQDELAKSGQTAEQVTVLQQQLVEANKAKAEADSKAEALTAQHAADLKLLESGVQPGKLAQFKALLSATGVDQADAAAVQAAIASIKADAPGLFVDGGKGYVPSLGANNPPKTDGQPTPDEVAAMSPEQYKAWREGKK
jgi:murein L,D-transpeptidase YcbB/YkuD